MLALPHSGNWDMAGVWLTNTYGGFATVAERLKPESLYKRFLDYRESLGFEVLPLTGGARPPFEILAERLRGNGLVCLMSDRDLTRSGVQVDLFGEPTRLPAGPPSWRWRPARRCLPCTRYYEPDVAVTAIRAPLDISSGDVGAITQALADQFATNIAAHPADWHMLQPQWLADLSDERRSPALPAAEQRSDPGRRRDWGVLMRIGMVCPYSFDVPGGVQAHVLQLAEVMRSYGHDVSVLAPSSPRRRRCPTTSSPAARPSPSRTTGRSRGCASAPPRTAR